MANTNGSTATTFLFKKLPDLSYRSHKLSPLCPVTNDTASSFEIRPAFLDRVRVPTVKTSSANLPNAGRYWLSGSMGTMSSSAETGVTGIPNLVELDDAFNTLDPGQLLRESAAAASRMLSDPAPGRRASTSEMVDELLQQIYAPRVSRATSEEDDVAEEADDELSMCSATVGGAHFSAKCADSLKRKDVWELDVMRDHLQLALKRVTSILIQQLTRRDRLRLQRERHCDVITAILQAASPKRSQDTKMRFSVDPPVNSGNTPKSPVKLQHAPDSSGFQQWHDAMRMVARLPGGVPSEFRRKLWLTLAEQHLLRTGVDWTEVERNCFNDRINPEDEELGAQIVRDLHRTGCSLFCGDDALPNQALLKRVLLAYARWNKAVGYCQGLNVLAALLLEVMNRSESESLKVMIYLIEGVLPEGYFANNLRGLSVDMAVFRDLLRQRLPALSRHLEMLQQPGDSGGSYCIEPPLTNVFTMQWFLTLFATCLPKAAVLRVWDLIFLEGNDVLLRTALAIWQTLAERILTVRTCDDFYSIMAVLAREMLEFGLMEPNHLVQTIVSMAPFPFPGLGELRDKYRYNITPWSGGGGRVRLFYSDDDPEAEADEDEDEEKTKALNAIATVFGGLMTSSALFRQTGRRITDITFRKQSAASSSGSCDKEKLQLDIAALRKQYAKLRERQKQAHVMFWTAAATNAASPGEVTPGAATTNPTAGTANANPLANLLAGKKPLLVRRSSSSAASGASAGPRLRLPPARVVPPHHTPTTTQNVMHAYFSAPTTPSDKDTDGPFAVMSGQQCIAHAEKDSSTARPRAVNQSSRRNSSSAAPELKPTVNASAASSKAAASQPSAMSANRSRLVQELLEQNSAMLQKLKDRSDIGSGAQQTSSEDASVDDVNKLISPCHNPFPRQLIRPPKEVTVKLRMYDGSSEKY